MPSKATAKKKTTAAKATVRHAKIGEDFKHAALVVSVLINLFVFVGWLVLQTTSKYDEQVAAFLFGN